MGLFGGMMKKAAETAEMVGGGARSSTASHYSKNYESVTAGVAADEFYGIPLKIHISDAEPETLMYLVLLIICSLVVYPRTKFLHGPLMSVYFWVAMLAAAYVIKEVTFYPIISTIILTRTIYPYPLVISHCITANCGYRKERGPKCTYLESLWLGFFGYGFGGTILSDVLMGLPITAMTHFRIVPVWVMCWALVWFCPSDYIYQMWDKKSSALYYFICAMVHIDVVVTPLGRVSRSARELQNKLLAPIMAGTMSGIGGAAIRYCERVFLRGGDESVKKSSALAIEAGFWKALGYSVLWWYIAVHKCTDGSYGEDEEIYHCGEFNGKNMDRFLITVLHVAWCVACDFGLASSHPFIFLSTLLRNVGSQLAYNLGYGPPEPHLPSPPMNGQHVKVE